MRAVLASEPDLAVAVLMQETGWEKTRNRVKAILSEARFRPAAWYLADPRDARGLTLHIVARTRDSGDTVHDFIGRLGPAAMRRGADRVLEARYSEVQEWVESSFLSCVRSVVGPAPHRLPRIVLGGERMQRHMELNGGTQIVHHTSQHRFWLDPEGQPVGLPRAVRLASGWKPRGPAKHPGRSRRRRESAKERARARRY